MEGNTPSYLSQTTELSDPLDVLVTRSNHQVQTSVGHILSANSADVHLSAEDQSIMMKSIQEIFELEEEQNVEMNDDGEEEEVDLEDQQRRTEKLERVLTTLAQLWWNDSEHMDLAAKKLADRSRDRECSLP